MNKASSSSAPILAYAPGSGSDAKKHTVFVSNLPEDVDEESLLNVFVTFGDIIEVQLPKEPSKDGPSGNKPTRHRGFAFLTYTSSLDAQDAIDNYDLNHFPSPAGSSRVLRVNLARAMKGGQRDAANANNNKRAIWAQEEWIKSHALPLDQSTSGIGEDRPSGATAEDGEQEEEVELEQ